MKKSVVFAAVLFLILFLSCGTDTGEGNGTAQKGTECISSFDCQDGYQCINGNCVEGFNNDGNDTSEFSIQKTALEYCSKIEECFPDDFDYIYDDIEECINDFTNETSEWYEEESAECRAAYESLLKCIVKLNCSDLQKEGSDFPCYSLELNYYQKCEEGDEEPDYEVSDEESSY